MLIFCGLSLVCIKIRVKEMRVKLFILRRVMGNIRPYSEAYRVKFIEVTPEKIMTKQNMVEWNKGGNAEKRNRVGLICGIKAECPDVGHSKGF